MPLLTLVVLSSGLLTADVPTVEETADLNVTEVEGDWECVSCIYSARPFMLDMYVGDVFSFHGHICLWSSSNVPAGKGTFDIGRSGSPTGIVIHFIERTDTWRGVCQVRGEWMEFAWVNYGPTPTRLESEKGSNVYLMKFHRVKK